MGAILIASTLPQIVFILIGGLAGDRLPRRVILLLSDGVRSLVVLLIAALGWLHLLQLWHLIGLSLIFGGVGAFFYPAYRAMPPQLVEREALPSANALTEFSTQLGALIGPLLGAWLVAIANPSTAFAFDGITFLASAASLLAIRLPTGFAVTPEDERPAPRIGVRGMLTDLREGLAYITSSTWLLVTIVIPAFANVGFFAPMTVALPKLVHDVYQTGVWLLGAIGTAEAVGWIVGTLVVAQFRLRRRGLIFFLSDLIAGAALLAFAAPLPRATEPFVVIAAAMVMGVGLSLGQTIWVTLLHQLVPNDKLGRVSSIDLLGSMALLPIGYALAGVLTNSSGPRSVFVAGGTLCVLLNIIPLFLRAIRELD